MNTTCWKREQMTCLFVLIDSRLEPQRIDLEFIEWLGENGIPFALIFTKADKQSVGKTKASVNRFLDTLKEQWKSASAFYLFFGKQNRTAGNPRLHRTSKPFAQGADRIKNILQTAIFIQTVWRIFFHYTYPLNERKRCFLPYSRPAGHYNKPLRRGIQSVTT